MIPAFQDKNIELTLLHIGSWGHDMGRPPEEFFGGLRVRDISHYQGMSFRAILEKEEPDAVLFLSTQAFAHRALNRYCRYLGIPTIHLYHGLVTVQSVKGGRLHPVNLRRQLVMGLARLPKNMFRLWPVYARALVETGANLREWQWFVYDVCRKASGDSYGGRAAADASTTAGCVYTDADVDHAVTRYGIARERVYVVGNPDLARMGVTASDIGSLSSESRVDARDVMYVDTALVAAGAVFDDEDDFVQHLVETARALERAKLRLVTKLHPAHYLTSVPEKLRASGIEDCPRGEFVARLRGSRAAIVEPSSAALVPALIGLPLLLARYGKLQAEAYGDVLTAYPRSRSLTAIHDIQDELSRLDDQYDPERTRAWAWANAGPLPAEAMPARVAAACVATVGQSPRLRSRELR